MEIRVGQVFGKGLAVAVVAASLGFGAGAFGQGSGAQASGQDKQFLRDLGKDSNFEIKTSELALAKSPSADVKEYARMVIHDHKELKQEISSANRAAQTTAVPTSSMTSDDQKMCADLKGLSGEAFDQAYIKELVKGNDSIQKEEKSEASDSGVPAVKSLAQKSAEVDEKHAAKAKDLAEAHHVQG